jgi:putative ABC transport system permease protein
LLIMRQSVRPAAIGAAIGSVLAVIATRILAANIQSMPAFDGAAFAGAFAAVLLACLFAAFIPSRRAARVEPTIALRQE